MEDAPAVPADPVVAAADAATINADGTSDASATPSGETQATEGQQAADDRSAMDPSWTQPAPEEKKTEQSQSGPTPSKDLSAPKTEDGTWFVDKYQGDLDKAAQAYKESVKALNETKAENDRLKASLSQPEQPSTPPPGEEKEFLDFVAASPEVRHLDQKMVALKAEHKQYLGVAEAVVKSIDEVGEQIRELQTALFESTDFEELSSTRDKIKVLDRKRQAQQQRLDVVNAKLGGIADQYNSADVTIRIAINGLKSQFDNHKAIEGYARAEQVRQQKVQNKAVLDAIPAAATKLKIPADQMDDFKKHVIRAGNAFLSMRDDSDVPFVVDDWTEFFVQHGQEFKGMVDRLHRSQSATYATQKVADATQRAPAGQAALAPQDKQPMNERDLDRWIKQQRL